MGSSMAARIGNVERLLTPASELAPVVVLAGTLLPWFVAREVGESGRPSVFGFASTPGMITLSCALLACVSVAALRTSAARWSGALRATYAAFLLIAIALTAVAALGPWGGDGMFDFTRWPVNLPMPPSQTVGGAIGVWVSLAGAAVGLAAAASWAVGRRRPTSSGS